MAEVAKDLEANYAHPKWLIKSIQHAWPDNYQDILAANNSQQMMSLRVNLNKITREEYIDKLKAIDINAIAYKHR